MRILAIDTSPRHGIVSRSVQTAADAAKSAGAKVEFVRLAELEIRSCTGCGMCRVTGECKIADDLPGLAERIASADGVIIGTPSYFRKPDDTTAAFLKRVSGYFSSSGQMRLPGMGGSGVARSPAARDARRAVIITACAAPEPLATFFGYTTGPVRDLRAALGSGGIRTVGTLAVTDTWRHPVVHQWECDKARSLGRIVAGKI
ncbi:MAG: flavodoxin family protein [Coriobacteriia bacterium]|jgi:NAD(P)H-dependent FMN reductase|nr:flavodoxin family protein [Coriobacteriia bacterium]